MHLPLSVIDSSAGKDMIDDVCYGKDIAIQITFDMVRLLSLLYTFIIAFTTLINFNVFFSSTVFLLLKLFLLDIFKRLFSDPKIFLPNSDPIIVQLSH